MTLVGLNPSTLQHVNFGGGAFVGVPMEDGEFVLWPSGPKC